MVMAMLPEWNYIILFSSVSIVLKVVQRIVCPAWKTVSGKNRFPVPAVFFALIQGHGGFFIRRAGSFSRSGKPAILILMVMG